MVRACMIIGLLAAGSLSAQVRYVPNAGQWPDHIHHRAEVMGGGVQLEEDGWVSWQWAPETTASEDHHVGERQGILWEARWIDPRPLSTEDWSRHGLASDRQHFYLSDDPSHWAEHVQAAQVLQAEEVWPGIAVRWRGTRNGRAAFEFTVSPGADPNLIGWHHRGVRPEMDTSGVLRLNHALHDRESGFSAELAAPFAFQLTEAGVDRKSVV